MCPAIAVPAARPTTRPDATGCVGVRLASTAPSRARGRRSSRAPPSLFDMEGEVCGKMPAPVPPVVTAGPVMFNHVDAALTQDARRPPDGFGKRVLVTSIDEARPRR